MIVTVLVSADVGNALIEWACGVLVALTSTSAVTDSMVVMGEVAYIFSG